MTRRRFHCSEADYLTDRGVDLSDAVQYHRHYGVASIARLWVHGIGPATANAQFRDPADLVQHLKDRSAA